MNDQIVIKDYDKPLECNIKRLERSLVDISPVVGVQHRLSEIFISLFLANFADLPPSSDRSGHPLNRSNWTHHTYFAMRSTAKTLEVICTFETMGRLDAIVESVENYPGIVLLAEWETNSSSIFGAHNELEKLWTGVNEHECADAFLFTYCPVDTLYDFTRRVVEYWQSRKTTRQNSPSLFLTIVAYRRVGKSDHFVFIRTLEIGPSVVSLWHDLGFVAAEEYLECIEGL